MKGFQIDSREILGGRSLSQSDGKMCFNEKDNFGKLIWEELCFRKMIGIIMWKGIQ